VDSSALLSHFDAIASSYRTVRTTDEQHVSHIRGQLPDRPLVGIDIGAGTGRYTERLLDTLKPESLLIGADFNHSMLVRLAREEERRRIPAVGCISEKLPFAGSSVDFVTTFNAVHHFDLCQFVNEVARVLKPGGDLFIYTRTPAQNANSIWGRHFPDFAARETRLHDEARFQQALSQFDVVKMTCFEFTRRATRARLIDQVRHHHYSTFALYEPDELADALDRFLDNLGETTEQCWQDRNLLVHARRPLDAGTR
jgi:ubiquinone/menaquinone biosynthesis C-methylase UbiE